MPPKNAFYAQSGGVTAVINASACGVIETARLNRKRIAKGDEFFRQVGMRRTKRIEADRTDLAKRQVDRHDDGGARHLTRSLIKPSK